MFLQRHITNISGLQLFQLLRFGILLLINIVLAKSSLSTESIGEYELFLFITALFCSFWINGLIQSFLPLYKSNSFFKSHSDKSPEIYNAFILLSLLSMLTILILLVFKERIALAFTDSSQIPNYELLLVYIFFSSPSFLIEYIYLLKNKPQSIFRYGIITFSAQLIIVAAPVVLGYGITPALAGLVTISFLRYIWLLVLLTKYARFTFSSGFLKEHLHVGYPLIISTLLGSSASYIDGFLVLNHFDSATFAIFRYGAKEFPLVLLLANALSSAMITEFSHKEKLPEALASLHKRSERLMHLLFPATILFLIFSHRLYPVVFNPDFAESASIFNIYLLLITSRLIFPHTILLGQKKTNTIMFASFAELLVNVTLSVIFIHLWGIAGVAFATVIAFAVPKLIWLTYNQVVLKIPPKDYIPLKVLGSYSFITLVIFLFVY